MDRESINIKKLFAASRLCGINIKKCTADIVLLQ